jgi:hypothetical protein
MAWCSAKKKAQGQLYLYHFLVWSAVYDKMDKNRRYWLIMDRVKVKLKLSLCLTKHHAMKMYWGSVGTAPHILELDTR